MSLSPKQAGFLAAYAETGVIEAAARIADVGRRSHYDWLADPEYAQAFKDAEDRAVELVEAECRRRAVVGTAEPVIYQGRVCWDVARDAETGEVLFHPETGAPMLGDKPLSIHKKSDLLLIFWLKSKRPGTYRDNATVEHTGAGGAPLSIKVEFVRPKATAAAPGE